MNMFFFIYIIVSASYFTIGLVTISNNWRQNINRNFLSICLNLSFWAFMLAIMQLTDSAQVASHYRRIMIFSWSTLYVQILYFSLYLTKRKRIYRSVVLNVCIMILPLLNFLFYLTSPTNPSDLVYTNLGWVYLLPTDRGLVWDHLFNFYYLTYMLMSILLIYTWKRTSTSQREQKQASLILISFIAVLLLGTITDVIFPMVGIVFLPPLSIVLVTSVISAMCYTILKYKLLMITPESIMTDVYKHMSEGIVIVDETNTILGINAGTEKILGYSELKLKGKNFDDLLEVHTPEAFSAKETRIKDIYGKTLHVLMTKGHQFDQFNNILGSVYTFSDITELKKTQSLLEQARVNLEDKVHKRTKQLIDSNDKLKDEVKKRLEKEAEINRLIYNDFLTNLPNRRYLDLHLSSCVQLSKLNNTKIAVLFMDLDSFKMVNDTMGHDAGDILLQQVAERLRITLREDDCICRVGGDEFIILLENIKATYVAEHVCDKIKTMLSDKFIIHGLPVYINTSIGVSIYPDDSPDIHVVLENADIAMYKVKENQKNDYILYNAEMRVGMGEVMYLTNELYKGVDDHQFLLYYQPQVNSKTQEIIGFEALVRWLHPSKGLISPDKFIHLGEQTGLILPLGEWIIKSAFKQAKVWNQRGHYTMGINLSPIQLMSPDFIKVLKDILDEVQVEPTLIEFEITESIFMNDSKVIEDNIRAMKTLGFRIAIDDFGTEYASLNYLKFLPLDRIKIPIEFIRGIKTYRQDEAIITSIITLSQKLNGSVIAEGVEQAFQIDFLRDNGCDEIQGYYYYRPMPADQIEAEIFNR